MAEIEETPDEQAKRLKAERELRDQINVIAALTRLRPQAAPQVKADFAKAFNSSLEAAGIAHGEQFFIVSEPLWTGLKEDRDRALDLVDEVQKQGTAVQAAETKRQYVDLLTALSEWVLDVDRGILTWAELKNHVDEALALEKNE